MSQLIKKFTSGGTSPASPEEDLKRQALQNSEHDNWRDAYAEYSGKNGSRKDRKEFRKAWKSGENVRERVGAETYDQLRQQEELEQFGTQGFESGSNGEQNRFNRRFNRRLRNGKLNLPTTPATPATPTAPVSQGQNSVIYPWNWDTYQIKPRGGLFSQSPIRTSYFPGAGAGDPELKPKTDWNAIAAEKLGEGKTMQDVIALQKQMGITADGKWGKQTQAAYDAYQQRIQNERLMGPTPDFVSPGTYFDVNGPSPLMKHSAYGNLGYTPTTPATPTTPTTPSSTPASSTDRKYDLNNSEYFRAPHAFANKDGGSQIITVNGKQYPIAVTKNMYGKVDGFENDQTYAYDETTGKFIKVRENMFGSVKGGFDDAQFEGDWFDPNSYYQKRQDWLKENPEPQKYPTYGAQQFTPEWTEWNKKYNEANPLFYQKQGGKMNRINYFQQGGASPQQQNMQQQVMQLVQAAMQGDKKATQTIQQVIQAAEQGDQQAQQIAQMIQQVMEQVKGQAVSAKWGSKLGYIKSLKYAKGGKTCSSCQNEGKSLETSPINKSLKKPIKKVEEKACGGKTKKR